MKTTDQDEKGWPTEEQRGSTLSGMETPPNNTSSCSTMPLLERDMKAKKYVYMSTEGCLIAFPMDMAGCTCEDGQPPRIRLRMRKSAPSSFTSTMV